MTKQDVTSRIWRTVVFSGAMLGAPLVAARADTPKDVPAQKPQPPPTNDKQAKPKDTVESVQKEIDALAKQIAQAIDAVSTAQNDADRKAARAKLDNLRKQRADAQARLDKLKPPPQGKPPPPSPAIVKLERELAELDAKLHAAIDALIAAQNDAERAAAKAKVESVRKERAAKEKELAAARAQAAKRPRSDESDRPVGRGFVLA